MCSTVTLVLARRHARPASWLHLTVARNAPGMPTAKTSGGTSARPSTPPSTAQHRTHAQQHGVAVMSLHGDGELLKKRTVPTGCSITCHMCRTRTTSCEVTGFSVRQPTKPSRQMAAQTCYCVELCFNGCCCVTSPGLLTGELEPHCPVPPFLSLLRANPSLSASPSPPDLH